MAATVKDIEPVSKQVDNQPAPMTNQNHEILSFQDAEMRQDYGRYKQPDLNVPLAEQLEIASLGTSGYKTGESEFDEDYYLDYQEY